MSIVQPHHHDVQADALSTKSDHRQARPRRARYAIATGVLTLAGVFIFLPALAMTPSGQTPSPRAEGCGAVLSGCAPARFP